MAMVKANASRQFSTRINVFGPAGASYRTRITPAALANASAQLLGFSAKVTSCALAREMGATFVNSKSPSPSTSPLNRSANTRALIFIRYILRL